MSTPTGTINTYAITQRGITISNTEKRIPETTTDGQFKGGTFMNVGTTDVTITFTNGTTTILKAGYNIDFSSDNGQSYKPMNIDATGGGLVYGTYYE
jgi:hypothetical protein